RHVTARVFLAAEQAQVRSDDIWFRMLNPGIIGPATELQASLYSEQTALAHVLTGNLSLPTPELYVEPVGLFFLGGAIDSDTESGLDTPGFEVAHLWIASGSSYQHYSIDHDLYLVVSTGSHNYPPRRPFASRA